MSNKKNKRKITVYDIAQKTGFSQSTVSKVLNNYPNISQATRDTILNEIELLGFSPNPIAISLAKKKTRKIGLIVDDISNPYYAESAKAILNRSNSTNYKVIISDSFNESIYDSINRFSHEVDGILIASVKRNAIFDDTSYDHRVPLLFYNQCPDIANLNKIILNDQLGAYKATEHLFSLGHRKIAYISGSLSRSTYNNRFKGYTEFLTTHNIELPKDYIYKLTNKEDTLIDYVTFLHNKCIFPDAFFASSDAIAFTLIAAIYSLGLKVPSDVSVIGFGDVKMASHPLINLTTISQNIEKLSILAFDSLLKVMEDNSMVSKNIINIVEPRLQIRGTTSTNFRSQS